MEIVQLKENELLVTEAGLGKFTQQIVTDHHVLNADEPIAYGGNDLGPSPYDFLLAALGACTSMTIRYYAAFKKIPVEKVVVRLKHEKVHAKDCKNCEDKKSMLDHIDRKIELKGALSEEQRQRLLDIANNCPVHRTLTSQISITTELV